MNLVTAKNLYHSFGDQPLLDSTGLVIETGERICLVGRNGTGKSTLLDMLAGVIKPDDGEINFARDIRIAQLKQEVFENPQGSVYDCVALGLGSLSSVITEWHHLALEAASDPDVLSRLQQLQDTIETNHAWNLENRVTSTISLLGLPADTPFSQLSGGMKRRVLLGQALVADPDLLLLDEPTNHLDIDSIVWLEDFLRRFRGSLLFITHDRSFLQALATRIVDLDRGKLTSWPGDYANYLVMKQAQLDTEVIHNALFDKKLAQEEIWIRQGIKARRTRNEGRVRALKKLRAERAQRRQLQGRVKLATYDSVLSGKIVIEAENLEFGWPNNPVVSNFYCKILRGEKIGIIGPNGCGKSTLIRLLLGDLDPLQGQVKLGTKLEIAYFDQQREAIEPDKTVRENISDQSDTVTVNGKEKHVISYLKDFLFSEKKINLPAKALSGGERNRLLLAKLFTRPFNFLIMDEPTNDLDMETLELLEELLVEFKGTLLLVSHDRTFIDNIVTSTLVFESPGQVNEYVGGYQDWLRQRPAVKQATGIKSSSPNQKISDPHVRNRDQRELKELPDKIAKIEAKIADLQSSFTNPEFYQQHPTVISEAQNTLANYEQAMQKLFDRWQQLEDSPGASD
ncbi:MAG: ATP-binding cassette domain-containing protein [Gammaproteobacteria bacterium]|nr:ATP-binding cassette domain-containing protein [Gammaproteobacteria bacterium]